MPIKKEITFYTPQEKLPEAESSLIVQFLYQQEGYLTRVWTNNGKVYGEDIDIPLERVKLWAYIPEIIEEEI